MRPSSLLKEEGAKGSDSRKQEATQGYPLSQDSHHMDGVPYIPKDESASTCKPQRQRANEEQLFPVPLPFASLLPLNGWNNCGHEVALAEKVFNLFKCHSESYFAPIFL